MCGLRKLSRFKHPEELTQMTNISNHPFMITFLKVLTTIIPLEAYNVETIEYKNISFTVSDVCGEYKIRPLWRHHFANTQGEVVTKSVGQCVVMCVALLL